jgi:hypothetical protein
MVTLRDNRKADVKAAGKRTVHRDPPSQVSPKSSTTEPTLIISRT